MDNLTNPVHTPLKKNMGTPIWDWKILPPTQRMRPKRSNCHGISNPFLEPRILQSGRNYSNGIPSNLRIHGSHDMLQVIRKKTVLHLKAKKNECHTSVFILWYSEPWLSVFPCFSLILNDFDLQFWVTESPPLSYCWGTPPRVVLGFHSTRLVVPSLALLMSHAHHALLSLLLIVLIILPTPFS